jgi:TonB-dependent SusC/RagA subfamily outer membrane receptor
VYPQQKPYLHLDRQEYYGGDMIHVKAYLLNGLNHYPDTLSTNLYVELISPSKTRVEIKRFQMFQGFGIGDFHLSDTLPEGLYQIRAYTSWMKNFDPGFFFVKNFPIVNPAYSLRISPRQARENRKELTEREKLSEDIDLQFMPEGGDLVTGLTSTVGFKAVNPLGKGVDIDGRIVDEKGLTVTEFRAFHKGIGRFSLRPEKDKSYSALVKSGDRELRFPLPKPLETGLVMSAEIRSGQVEISLNRNGMPTADKTANEVIVVAQVGGQIYFREIVTLVEGSHQMKIEKRFFPSGIIQITAFSGRGIPLAERLIFNNRFDAMYIRMVASDTSIDDSRKILLRIFTNDASNNPLTANLSLAVTREKATTLPVNSDNMVSHLLLASDLKGFVEDPWEYFRDKSPVMEQALDNLMLTQGWRRFDWTKILAGEFPQVKYHEERGIAIYGQVQRNFFGLPLKDCKVQLSILNAYNDVFSQFTNEKGYFLFENMVYFDTISVKIEAWRRNGRKNLVIVVPDEEVTREMPMEGDYSLITESDRDKKAYRQEKYEKARVDYKKEQEELREQSKNELHGIYLEPDFVLRSKDFPMGSHTILDVMKGRIPGVNIYGDRVVIRGPTSLIGPSTPLYLIDGVPTYDVEMVKSIPVEQIDRVEVLKGPSAAIYGMRGANGVIAIYTKRGQYIRRGVIEFDMLGYSTPRTFYRPRYTPVDEPERNYTLVWEPVIITSPEGHATVVIDKPAIEGDYRFVIEGVSYMGHVGSHEEILGNQ